MGKTLVIAEKPSVAADITKALGGFKKEKDFFESDHMVVTSAIGHLVELCLSPELEKKRGKWSFENLPVIPEAFSLRPIEKTEARFKLLSKLLKRKDIDDVINACDSGREGELIFRYITQLAKSQKPVRRLWLRSMTKNAICDGFEKLRNGEELDHLADAAVCRSESDWLIGINGTRAFTALVSKGGGFHLTTVGRVQTPTLAILVDREAKIRRFEAKTYWEVHALFKAEAGTYEGRWFDEGFKKPAQEEGDDEVNHARAERLWDIKKAEAIRSKCEGKPGITEESKKPASQMPPLLYDLTSLQREANKRFGLSAKRTLQIAQALYERHKVITYPRTDSRALPEDYIEVVNQTMGMLKGTSSFGQYAAEALNKKMIHPNKRIFNNAKISDHFAIIPTTTAAVKLEEFEYKVYDMITRRFIAVFFPAAQFEITTRITRVESEPFKTEGKVLVEPGWLAVYGRTVQNAESPDEDEDEKEKSIIPVGDGKNVQTQNIDVLEALTKPPARYSEATLLSAMEGAGKFVEDDDLREAMSEKGIGTPATRAAIIDGLIYEQYIRRDGRELIPTTKGITLISLLRGINIPTLCSPEMTGGWEHKLKRMEKGEFTRQEFMREISSLTSEIVEKARNTTSIEDIAGEFVTLKTPCPKCGGTVKENLRTFKCLACDFVIWKSISGRTWEPVEVEELIEKKQVGPLSGFKSKMGRPFSALIKLNAENKSEFVFEGGPNGESGEQEYDFSSQESLGKCPVCTSNVYETPVSYVCEKAVGKDKSCTFRSGKMILQQPLDILQMRKLLSEGKTDFLPKFISTKTKRPFAALLKIGKGGKTEFEFAPREKKPKGGKKVVSKTNEEAVAAPTENP
ncbi:MAG: DNA topoisomerase III [Verrucomicrobiota bacterium]|nr:DNA topoisomerase III [Verrucomicrobiota bacterium]